MIWGSEPRERHRFGAWEVELRSDEIADIRFDGTLVARSIRAVSRDRDWTTTPVTVAAAESGPDGLRLDLHFRDDAIEVRGRLELRAATAPDGSGELHVAFTGTAVRDFLRARLGLVVLHPPTDAGAALRVVHPDGSTTDTAFPASISPHQPAFDIAELAWRTDGVDVAMRFAGDVFEMEDQRNWTDASYKTYSTPLALPFPVAVAAGEIVRQAVTVRAARVSPATAVDAHARRPIVLRPAGRPAPRVGVGAATAPDVDGPPAAPPADLVLVELRADAPNAALAVARAARAGLPLDVRLVAAEADQVRALVALLDGADAAVARIAVFHPRTHVTEPELWDALVAAAPGIPLAGGARSHFTELNRTHERLPAFPAVVFSVTPQMHAVESFQLVESIGMQRRVAQDAVRIADGAPVIVGPVTLRSRYNAVATTPPPAEGVDLTRGYGAELVAGATDPRQPEEPVAAWLVASAAALAAGGADEISWFEEWGPRGLADADTRPYPAHAAMAAVHALAGAPLLVRDGIRDDDRTWALGVERGDGTADVLVAHLGDAPVELDLEVELAGGARRARVALAPLSWTRVVLPAGAPVAGDR